jgi:hypothetical protein
MIVGIIIAAVGGFLKPSSPAKEPHLPPGVQELPGPIVQQGDYRLSGPYAHDNLAVFLIHGPDQAKGKSYLTLQEALEQHKAVVHETGDVNELSVENLSSDADVYIQSGDIVKGGKQDRVLHYDLVLSPHSGKVPLSAFCVESGRWHGRADESLSSFSSSYSALPAKELKLATRYEQNQQKVWEKVAATRSRIEHGISGSIRTASESSLQLTLESPQVQESVKPTVEKLLPVVDGKRDVIGFAYAINGQVNSAEVYASHALFARLWPKLLRASAVEALAERKEGETAPAVSAESVRDFLADAERGKAYLQGVGKRTQQVMQETDRGLLFETRDRQQGDAWVHRSYLKK